MAGLARLDREGYIVTQQFYPEGQPGRRGMSDPNTQLDPSARSTSAPGTPNTEYGVRQTTAPRESDYPWAVPTTSDALGNHTNQTSSGVSERTRQSSYGSLDQQHQSISTFVPQSQRPGIVEPVEALPEAGSRMGNRAATSYPLKSEAVSPFAGNGAPSSPPVTKLAGLTMPAPPTKPVVDPSQPLRPRGIVAVDQNDGGRVGMSNALRAGDLLIDDVLRDVVFHGASDLHLTDRSTPMIRKSGALIPLEGYAPMTGESLRRSLFTLLTQKQREKFEEQLELDFAYHVPDGERFRVNFYVQRDTVGAAFRVIPSEIKPLEALGVPPIVNTFSKLPRGLVLVTGPTGSGKSTTLASIIDQANRTRSDHIMTVEDPIEFLHDHKRSIVNQREVGTDTWSFASALKHVLRQDPDIILVGELRDLETISVALTAAETGHLVFATLHTQDAAQTIDRVIDVFPAEQQEQIRVQLASAIQGVVSQTLCKRQNGPGRVVATEVMVATPAIRNLIREGKTHQIYSLMQAGAADGMHTMDQHLADLVKTGAVSYEVGLDKCHSASDFNRLSGRRMGGAGMGIANAGMGGNIETEGAY